MTTPEESEQLEWGIAVEERSRAVGPTVPDPVTAGSQSSGSLSARHRLVLLCLAAKGGTASLVTLTRDVAAYIRSVPPGAVSTTTMRRVYREVRGSMLKELEERGHVEYCGDVGNVVLRS